MWCGSKGTEYMHNLTSVFLSSTSTVNPQPSLTSIHVHSNKGAFVMSRNQDQGSGGRGNSWRENRGREGNREGGKRGGNMNWRGRDANARNQHQRNINNANRESVRYKLCFYVFTTHVLYAHIVSFLALQTTIRVIVMYQAETSSKS